MASCKRQTGRELAVEPLEDRTLLSGYYDFVKIADSSDEIFKEAIGFEHSPSINDTGRVAFQTEYRQGVFTGAGDEKVTPIVFGLPLDFELDSLPAIGNGGSVAFTISYTRLVDPIDTLYVGDNSPPVPLYSDIDFCARTPSAPSINKRETEVAFASGCRRIFRGNGGPLVTIAQVGEEFSGFAAATSLNEAHQVAFYATLTSGNGSGIFVGDGIDAIKTVAIGFTHGFNDFGFVPSINSNGIVAFYATRTTGGSGIYAGYEGQIALVAETGDLFRDFGPAPAINAANTIAFEAHLTTGGSGIFSQGSGWGLPPTPVIATGDPLLGSTVTQLGFFHQGLNELGQVAFWAELADGREVIVRADPYPTIHLCPPYVSGPAGPLLAAPLSGYISAALFAALPRVSFVDLPNSMVSPDRMPIEAGDRDAFRRSDPVLDQTLALQASNHALVLLTSAARAQRSADAMLPAWDEALATELALLRLGSLLVANY